MKQANMNERLRLDPKRTALLIIDMQRDFLHKGGFGELLGNDPTQLRKAIKPTQKLLQAARKAGLKVIFTREGHKPDLSDVPQRKLEALPVGKRIGDKGPMGRILIRGEYGHDIIDEVKPLPGEKIIDKPGKGSFYKTNLEQELHSAGITHFIVAGVTTSVCDLSTIIEGNDRGFHPIVPRECVAAYDPRHHNAALTIIAAQNGLFGRVTTLPEIIKALRRSHIRR